MALIHLPLPILLSMTSLCVVVMMQLRYTVRALMAECFVQAIYSKHISVTNSILTPDIAHPINIGTHGDPYSAWRRQYD